MDAVTGAAEQPVTAGQSPVLSLPPTVLDEIAASVEAAYPREGCGVLLGRVEGRLRRVDRQVSAENRWADREDRYLVDPGTLRRLLEEEERGGPRILGFYHSHPDARPKPSRTDREHAWPWYHYLILPVTDGRTGEGRVWELDPEEDRFVERTLRLA